MSASGVTDDQPQGLPVPLTLPLAAATARLIMEGTAVTTTAVPKQLAAMPAVMTCPTARAVMWLLMAL
jgi:hypothetical protein